MVQSTLVRMIDYFGKDVQRINHALKVHSFARLIALDEKIVGDQLLITELAAILHDIGIPVSEQKYGSCIGTYQEIEGPPIAREMLEEVRVKPEIVERVCYLIGNHHSYSKIDGVDFQILVEADFLVNIFEDEMNMDAIVTASEKCFRTPTGKRLVESIYFKQIT